MDRILTDFCWAQNGCCWSEDLEAPGQSLVSSVHLEIVRHHNFNVLFQKVSIPSHLRCFGFVGCFCRCSSARHCLFAI